MRRTALTGFYEQTRAARKIIVVDPGFLGDSLHPIPALWELREHYPESGSGFNGWQRPSTMRASKCRPRN